ncbi:hypothetical protein EXU34_22650, partial [Alteromonas sp. ZYF713]|nr:hypothetical protein [Alteromonas sp. ZYF713]
MKLRVSNTLEIAVILALDALNVHLRRLQSCVRNAQSTSGSGSSVSGFGQSIASPTLLTTAMHQSGIQVVSVARIAANILLTSCTLGSIPIWHPGCFRCSNCSEHLVDFVYAWLNG